MWCNVSLLRFCSQTFNLHHENSDWNCLKMQPGPQWVEASPAPGGSLCYLKSLTQLKRSSLNIFLWFSCTSCINPPPSTDDQGHSSHFIPQSSRHVLISTDNLYWSKNTIDVPPQVLSTETEQSYWLTFKKGKETCEEKLRLSRTSVAQQTEREISPVPVLSGAWWLTVASLRDSAMAWWHFEHCSFTRFGLFILCLHREQGQLNYSLPWNWGDSCWSCVSAGPWFRGKHVFSI